MEVYRKYSQSVAVLLMFLIGAPLGSIIKKGGLGVPILAAGRAANRRAESIQVPASRLVAPPVPTPQQADNRAGKI